GDAHIGLRVATEVCDVPWTPEGCPGQGSVLGESVLPIDGIGRALLTMPADEQRWIRFLVSMPADIDPMLRGSVSLRTQASGFGEVVDIGPEADELANTGGVDPWPLAWVGLALLVIGAAVARRSSVRL